MYANDEIFAKGAQEGRRKQEIYILPANSITGLIVDLKISDTHEICVFRNRTSFETERLLKRQMVLCTKLMDSVGNNGTRDRYPKNAIAMAIR